MISTCSHKNYKSSLYRTYAISGNRGKDAGYNGNYYKDLAPKMFFWKIWHDNFGFISEDENNKFYVEQYYNHVLSKLDPDKIYRELDSSILLCYEDNEKFCHRHIVAEWLQITLEVKVPEIKVDGCLITEITRPSYIRDYLEEVMKKDKNMRGFKSLRALYLFEKSEIIEQKANELENRTGKNYDAYRQAACYLRCDADEAEAKYNNMKLVKRKNN